MLMFESVTAEQNTFLQYKESKKGQPNKRFAPLFFENVLRPFANCHILFLCILSL